MKCDKCGAMLYPGSCREAPGGIPLFVCDRCYNELKHEQSKTSEESHG